jgi:hypothetical protein
VVARRGHQAVVAPVRPEKERRLAPVERLFDDDSARGLAADPPARHQLFDRTLSLPARARDDHALARRESVGLDDDGRVRAAELAAAQDSQRLLDGRGDAMARGRDFVAEHEIFGEGFARFEPRGLALRPCDHKAAARKLVGQTGGERRFAADDCQLDALALGEVGQARNVGRAQSDALGVLSYSSVAGRAEEAQVWGARACLERAAERMLAPA